MNLLLVDSSVSQEEQSTFSLPSGVRMSQLKATQACVLEWCMICAMQVELVGFPSLLTVAQRMRAARPAIKIGFGACRLPMPGFFLDCTSSSLKHHRHGGAGGAQCARSGRPSCRRRWRS